MFFFGLNINSMQSLFFLKFGNQLNANTGSGVGQSYEDRSFCQTQRLIPFSNPEIINHTEL